MLFQLFSSFAALGGFTESAALIIKRAVPSHPSRSARALLDHRNLKGETPLLWAAMAPYDPPPDGASATPSMSPSKSPSTSPSTSGPATLQNLASVRLLLDHGADPNIACTKLAWTPLMYACCYGKDLVVCALLDAGADPLVRNVGGHTALGVAQSYGRAEAAAVVKKAAKEKRAASGILGRHESSSKRSSIKLLGRTQSQPGGGDTAQLARSRSTSGRPAEADVVPSPAHHTIDRQPSEFSQASITQTPPQLSTPKLPHRPAPAPPAPASSAAKPSPPLEAPKGLASGTADADAGTAQGTQRPLPPISSPVATATTTASGAHAHAHASDSGASSSPGKTLSLSFTRLLSALSRPASSGSLHAGEKKDKDSDRDHDRDKEKAKSNVKTSSSDLATQPAGVKEIVGKLNASATSPSTTTAAGANNISPVGPVLTNKRPASTLVSPTTATMPTNPQQGEVIPGQSNSGQNQSSGVGAIRAKFEKGEIAVSWHDEETEKSKLASDSSTRTNVATIQRSQPPAETSVSAQQPQGNVPAPLSIQNPPQPMSPPPRSDSLNAQPVSPAQLMTRVLANSQRMSLTPSGETRALTSPVSPSSMAPTEPSPTTLNTPVSPATRPMDQGAFDSRRGSDRSVNAKAAQGAQNPTREATTPTSGTVGSERRSVLIVDANSNSVHIPGDEDDDDQPAEDLFSRSVKAIVAKSRSQSFSASADQDALVRRLVAAADDPTRAIPVGISEGTDSDGPAPSGSANSSRKNSLFRKLSVLSQKSGGTRLAAIVGDSVEALGDSDNKADKSKEAEHEKNLDGIQISGPTRVAPMSNYIMAAQSAMMEMPKPTPEVEPQSKEMKTTDEVRPRSRSSSLESSQREQIVPVSSPDDKMKLTRQRSASFAPESGLLAGHRPNAAHTSSAVPGRSRAGSTGAAIEVMSSHEAPSVSSFVSRLPVSAASPRIGSTSLPAQPVKLRVLHPKGEATFKVSSDVTFTQIIKEGILRNSELPGGIYFKIRPVGVEAWEFLPGDKVKVAMDLNDGVAGLPPLPGAREGETVVSVKVTFHKREIDLEELIGKCL
ncbi:hypothetical protein M427DRAFT_67659 [Gonapodya prolifera JEL478]|uniref:Uncharacterized protein n=1 Tax=Gonapodya prolifera (strain JEL478) TaxID=1344416 RepID=A0A139APG8_GONPJ|nr:hypothetical protein M427DRAFT_67659 [Gonapodya prolifera JEL478]|eukprot:KXS18636.1 hypothetical protein M427DRAFT_67659 [Gonapodya prolifera JEL478]